MKFAKTNPESGLHKDAAANQSIEEGEKPEHEREQLRQIALGDREIESGKGYSLESVLKEADALPRDWPS